MLEPADEKQCQVFIKAGSFMTFGPRPRVRCENKPIVIVKEKNLVLVMEDGECGSMSKAIKDRRRTS